MTPYYGIIVTPNSGVEEWSGSLEEILIENLGKPDVDNYNIIDLHIERIGSSNSFHCKLVNEQGNIPIEYFVKPEDRCAGKPEVTEVILNAPDEVTIRIISLPKLGASEAWDELNKMDRDRQVQLEYFDRQISNMTVKDALKEVEKELA